MDMDIKVLGSAGGQAPGFDTTGFRIGADLLLDAGSIGLYLTLEEQRAIRHVLLTHAHLDHVHALPFLLDNLIGRVSDPVTVYATAEILGSLQRHVFNGQIWPDFTVLPSASAPVLRLQPVEPGRAFQAGTLRATAVSVEHTVPAVGYLVAGPDAAAVFTGDTGSARALWEQAAGAGRLRAVFAEASFPAEQKELARLTRHLTAGDVERELAQAGIPADVPVYLYHLKPEFAESIGREAERIAPWRVRPVTPGETIRI